MSEPVSIFTTEAARRVWDAVRAVETMRVTGPGVTMKRHDASMAIHIAGDRRGANLVSRFRVVSVSGDFLICKPVVIGADGQPLEIEETIPVAKPYMLRRTPFDGQTVEFSDGSRFSFVYASHRRRTSTRLADDEENIEVLTPDYLPQTDDRPGETILALRGPTDVLDADNVSIGWEDMNQAARAWATEAL